MRCASRFLLALGIASAASGQDLKGHVFDRDGRLLMRGWTVHAQSTERPRRSHLRSRIDDKTGGFQFVLKPEATYNLWAACEDGRNTPTIKFEPSSGTEWYVPLTCSAPPPERCVTLSFSLPDEIYPKGLWEAVHLIAEDGSHIEAPSHADRHPADLKFQDLEPGSYRLQVNHARYKPIDLAGLRPGSKHKVALEGPSSLRLLIEDERGQPAESCTVWAVHLKRFVGGYGHVPEKLEVVSRPGTPCREGLVLPGQFPGDGVLLVQPAGASVETIVRWEDLERGEDRVLRVPFPRISEARSLRISSDQNPGWSPPSGRIQLRCLEEELLEVEYLFDHKVNLRSELIVQAEPDGSYELPAVHAGAWRLLVPLDPVGTYQETLQLDPGVSRRIELQVPDFGALRGKLKLAPHTDLTRLRIGLQVMERPGEAASKGHAEARPVGSPAILPLELDAQGRFFIPGLPTGPLRVSLLRPEDSELEAPIAAKDVTIHAGRESEFQLDLYQGPRPTLSVQLQVDGSSQVGEILLYSNLTPENGWDQEAPFATLPLGLDRAKNRWLVEGPTYEAIHLAFRNKAGDWRYDRRFPVKLAWGKETDLRIPLQVTDGTLRFLDKTRKPWPGLRVQANSRLTGIHPRGAKSDEQGELSWSFPDGQMRLRFPDNPELPDLWLDLSPSQDLHTVRLLGTIPR